MSVPTSGQETPNETVGDQSPMPLNTKKKFNNGWTKELENLMADWADKAACYRWMHEKTSIIYQNRDRMFNIPIIVLSGLTAGANFALTSITGDDKEMAKWAQLGLGGASLITGIIQTFMNMYAYAKGSEAHRVAGISWGKFNRLLCIEMNLHPNERMESLNFLKMFRVELDRLIEQSPPIPENVIKDFNQVFKESEDVIRPEITGILHHTKVYTDTNSRLKRIAAEATINLHYKRGILKQLVADDIELKTRQVAIDAAKDVAREIIEKEKEKLRSKQPVSTNNFIEKQKEERAKEIQSILKSKAGTVSELRNMFNKRHPSIDSSSIKEKDTTTITINEEPTITIINDDKNNNSLNTTENQDIVEVETIIKEDNTIYDKI
jgi:hypothetical protein